MDTLPALERLSAPDKDALMLALWAEVQRLQPRLAALEATSHAPRKDAHHARGPPAHTPTPKRAPGPRLGTRRQARVGRAGGDRPRPPEPDQVLLAQAQPCPHGGGTVQAHEPHLHAVSEKSEGPPIRPIVTRVEPHAGPCPHGGQADGAPVPVGMEPGTPCGPSIQSLAIPVRSPHAIRAERWAALCGQGSGVPLREAALANLCPRGKPRVEHRGAAIRTRWRRRRLRGRDATSARVTGQPPWAWGGQHAAGCSHVSRPRRGPGVLQDVLGAHRPTIWGSDLSRAQTKPPADAWPGCWAHQRRAGPLALEAGDPGCAPGMQAGLLRALAIYTRRALLAASPLSQDRGALSRRLDRC
jgi:transposase